MPHRPRCLGRIRRVARHPALLVAVLVFAAAVVARSVSRAQPGNEIVLDVDAGPEDAAGAPARTAGDQLFPGAAGLNVDPERERLMARAQRYAAEGQVEPALARWQRMLDEPRTRMHSGRVTLHESLEVRKTAVEKLPYGRYRTLGAEIEQIIAESPPAVRDAYRETADPAARALLNDKTADRRAALARAVHSYFLSSYGDDAAYELAALRFDRGELPEAARLLTRILEDYPRPDVSREKVLFRLALAEARLGHAAAARQRLAELDRLPAADVSQTLRQLAAREVEAAAERPARSASGRQPAENAGVDGPMPSPPSRLWDGPLTEEWIATREPRRGGLRLVDALVAVNSSPNVFGVAPAPASRMAVAPSNSGQLAAEWRRNGWTPAASLLVDGDRFYHAGDVDLICRDLATGNVLWRSCREYHHEVTALSQLFAQQRSSGAEGRRPQSPAEVRLFGDRVHQAMSLGDGCVYVLEGLIADVFQAVDTRGRTPRGGAAQRVRHNCLACYDSRNGKLKWFREAAEKTAEEEIAEEDACFLAAPVAAGERLFVPVSDRGETWLIALDARTGNTVWRSFLCDEPVGSASPWSPVTVACAGSDVYVAPGTGVVFALEAASGDVHWAVRYRRSGQFDPRLAQRGRIANYVRELDGWQEDRLLVHEGRLIVLASDYDRLFALDRRSGGLSWDAPGTPSQGDPRPAYCLGVVDDGLFVAGPRVVCRYDLAGGRLVWQQPIEGATGRGIVSRGGVYVPLAESIVRLDPATGRTTHQTRFVSPAAEPLGNLYSDDERLLVADPRRVYALVGLEQRLESLAVRIEQEDGRARLERMQLRRKLGEIDPAIEDLRAGWKLLVPHEGLSAALNALREGIDDLQLVSARPQIALALLVEAAEAAAEISPAADAAFEGERAAIVFAALAAIERRRPADGAAAVLSATRLYTAGYLVAAAQRAVEAAATPEDAPRLVEALAGDDPTRRVVAIGGLSAALEDEALDHFAALLDDRQEDVRFAAALALADRGDRRSLKSLVGLLDSDDLQIRARSIQVLRKLTGRQFEFVAYEPPERRREALRGWHEWLAEHGETADLHHPIDAAEPLLGRTLIGLLDNTVIEVDSEGKETWRTNATNPFGCEGQPNGHRLVTSYGMRTVTEYDADGAEVWQLGDLPASPYNARRLPNGNTLVACSNSGLVMEYRPDKSKAWEAKVGGRPTDAHRLPNGNTLVALQTLNRVVEVDQAGNSVRVLDNVSRPMAVQPLENGNILVCHFQEGRVTERDRGGNEVWQLTGLNQPYAAQRLSGGNTLIADQSGVREVDREGKMVWQRFGTAAASVHRY
ncbi:MAG: PQQ-binding-like beta-propeller repeat protein [Planctomycetales bacterium]